MGSNQQHIVSDDIVYFDGVTKATVSVMVVHDTILAAARKVAQSRLSGFGSVTKARLDMDSFSEKSLPEMDADGLLFHWEMDEDAAATAMGVATERLTAAVTPAHSTMPRLLT